MQAPQAGILIHHTFTHSVRAHACLMPSCIGTACVYTCRRPTGASPLIETIPRVAVLLQSALDYGVSDVDGGMSDLLQQCVDWIAAYPHRVWPTRMFASIGRWVN